jgi:hypothetical protein
MEQNSFSRISGGVQGLFPAATAVSLYCESRSAATEIGYRIKR